MPLPQDLLTSYQTQFAYYRTLGQRAMDQLTFQQLRADDETHSNSIAVIVKHLSGNMKSRWTNFMTSDGEKSWRNRDQEFVGDFTDREALQAAWDEGWSALESAINRIQPEQLTEIVYIRNDGHTVAEAINRQLAHYSYHVGQIVLLAKQHRGKDWSSLSIPRGQSDAYNTSKFNKKRDRRKFTDE
ncbi:MAG: DinB family protein [Lewinella sp.]